MNWQTLAVLQTIPAASQLLMLRHVARGRRKYNAAVINALTIVPLFVAGLLCAPFLGVAVFHEALSHSGLLLLGAAMFTATSIFMYKALEHLAAGIFSILQTMATLFTIALAVVWLHESFQHFQFLGATVLMLTIWTTLYLANREDAHLEKTANWRKGVFYTVLSALSLAVALTNEKYLLSHMAMSSYMTYEWGVQLIVAFLVAWRLGGRKGFRAITNNRTVVSWVVGSGIMRAAAAVFFILAQVYSNNIALVSVITNFKIIIIAVFGALILKEHKFFAHKLATASLAVFALLLMG